MAVCLLTGFILLRSEIPGRAHKAVPGHVAATERVASGADVSLGFAAVFDDAARNIRAPLPAPPRLADPYGKLPLSFEINRGQTDSRVKFLSRGSGSHILTGNEAVLVLKKAVQKEDGKREMAKGVAHRFLSNAPAFHGLSFQPPSS